MWIRHPRSGKKDAMLSLSVYAFLAVLGKFLVNGVTLGDLSLGTIDATLVAALLTPTLGAYTVRKWKDSPDSKKEEK